MAKPFQSPTAMLHRPLTHTYLHIFSILTPVWRIAYVTGADALLAASITQL